MVGTKDENSPDNAKFRDNFAHDEPEGRLPSQRALAVFRCRRLEILDARLLSPEPLLKPDAPASKSPVVSLAEDKIALHLGSMYPVTTVLTALGEARAGNKTQVKNRCKLYCQRWPRRLPSWRQSGSRLKYVHLIQIISAAFTALFLSDLKSSYQ